MPRWVFCFLLILAVPVVAQDCTQIVPILLADRDTGARIEALSAATFTAKIGAVPLQISGTARILASRIVVLIDESGSMDEKGSSTNKGHTISAAKRTLSDLFTALPPGVSVEYGLFNEKSVFSGAFANNPEELRRNIEETTTRFGRRGYGKTAMLDALHEALLRFGTPQRGDSILLFSDGGDNRSKIAQKQLENDFRAAHVRLLTMMVYESGVTPEEVAGPELLEELRAKTGGSSLAIGAIWVDQKTTVAMIRRFWNERVLTTDLIQVQVPGAFTSETKWKLTVNREADPRLKRAIVLYPDRLSPCSPTTASAH
jgi:hypothetical protein